MNQAMTIRDALHVAISEEIKAYNMYMKASNEVSRASAKSMLVELAEQEKGHQAFLEKMVTDESLEKLGEAIPAHSLGIAEFLAPGRPLDANATIQEIMIFAIKEEEKAENFYSDMQTQFAGTEVADIFGRLAAEERGHKLKLEEEYEDAFYKEN